MNMVRRANDRGHADFGWLDSKHSFSFGSYHDPQHMGFGHLRVINEDRVEPGRGFDTHGHRDMEIISYVIDGALEHKDSLGTGSVIRPGDVQRMSAGTGVRHSEFNHSQNAPVHFLQIWIEPAEDGLAPDYEEKHFSDADKLNRLRLVVSGDGRDGALRIHQDVDLYASHLQQGHNLTHTTTADRQIWLQVIRGALRVGAEPLSAGDGIGMSHQNHLTISADSDAQFLLFDMVAPS